MTDGANDVRLRTASTNANDVTLWYFGQSPTPTPTTKTKTESVDVLFGKRKSKTESISTMLEKVGVLKTDTTSVLLKKFGVTKTDNIGVLFKKLKLTKAETIDVLLYLRLTKTDSIDVVLKRLQATKTDFLSGLFKKLNISGYTEYELQDLEAGLIYGVVYDTQWYAQTFTPTTTHEVTLVKLFVQTSGNLAGLHFYVDIYATSGGFPTGSALATSGPLNGTSIWAPFGLKAFEISPITLVSGTQYALVVHMDGGDADHELDWEYNINGPYTLGAYCRSPDSGATWGHAVYGSYDFIFELWGAKAPLSFGVSVKLEDAP